MYIEVEKKKESAEEQSIQASPLQTLTFPHATSLEAESIGVKANTGLMATFLGEDFDKLHPEMQRRYTLSPDSGSYILGTGTMDAIWNGSALFRPFLWIGSKRKIMFPEQGEQIPFTIENWSYKDSFGRETLSLNREYSFPGFKRTFDEYMVHIPESSSNIIYAGTHQHLAVEIDTSVTDVGGLLITTGPQKLLLPGVSLKFPLLFSAIGTIHEWYDEESGCFRIDGRVQNKILGDVFCCKGSFSIEHHPIPSDGIPKSIKPIKEEKRF